MYIAILYGVNEVTNHTSILANHIKQSSQKLMNTLPDTKTISKQLTDGIKLFNGNINTTIHSFGHTIHRMNKCM